MILRLTEKAKHIVHIPRVLYYWRVHAGSVASGVGVKPYCILAAKRALQDHMERVGLNGEVTDSKVPSTYKINYELDETPIGAIIVHNGEVIAKACNRRNTDKNSLAHAEVMAIDEA